MQVNGMSGARADGGAPSRVRIWETGGNSLAVLRCGSGGIGQRATVEERLGGRGAAQQEGLEEGERIALLALGRDEEREVGAEGGRVRADDEPLSPTD